MFKRDVGSMPVAIGDSEAEAAAVAIAVQDQLHKDALFTAVYASMVVHDEIDASFMAGLTRDPRKPAEKVAAFDQELTFFCEFLLRRNTLWKKRTLADRCMVRFS